MHWFKCAFIRDIYSKLESGCLTKLLLQECLEMYATFLTTAVCFCISYLKCLLAGKPFHSSSGDQYVSIHLVTNTLSKSTIKICIGIAQVPKAV